MTLVLDASMALAWLLKRKNSEEASLAIEALDVVRDSGAMVPALWYPEIANALLVAERQQVISAQDSSDYLSSLSAWDILRDPIPPEASWTLVIALGRTYRLSAYDAAYLELILRTGSTLATFDRQLAQAVRKAGGRVFGDPQ